MDDAAPRYLVNECPPDPAVHVHVFEVKRRIIVELMCAADGTGPECISTEEMEWMFTRGDSVVYPVLIRRNAE
jgi:hypothetical protein